MVWILNPLRPSKPELGFIVICTDRRKDDRSDLRRRVDIVVSNAVSSLERLDVERALEDARMRASSETLREALIGSVTHDLRTPLATIIGSASILAKASTIKSEEQVAGLARLIDSAAGQLDLKISNLIDATRISSDGLKPELAWVDPTDRECSWSLDLIILDLGLPDMDGAEVVERLRSWSQVALIVLSVRSSEGEKVKLLELGADDYVVKPFGMAELLARARAALRRRTHHHSSEPVVEVGPLVIEFATRNVWLSGSRIQLAPKEYRLLSLLAKHAGNVVTQPQLLKEVWGAGHDQNAHYLRILVRKLRQKIEADPTDPQIVLTELGVGYRLGN